MGLLRIPATFLSKCLESFLLMRGVLNLNGGHLNHDGGRLNLDGRTLILDGETQGDAPLQFYNERDHGPRCSRTLRVIRV